ncbi:MAG: RimK/LysX family protein [Planctomycetota bacterium]
MAISLSGLPPAASMAAGDGEGPPPDEESAQESPAEEPAEGGEPAVAESAADSAAEEPVAEEAVAEQPPEPPVEDQPSEKPLKENPEKEEDSEEQQEEPPKKKRTIGATAVIKEYQSGLLFEARVDTGAKSCSLNVDQMVIVDEEEGWEANVGKTIKFRISNGKDEPQWIESKIHVVVRIKTSDNVERRYKVPLELQWKNVKKRVTVTLNDRSQMRYPLLVGRNFLKGDFVVDVEKGDTD